MRAKKSSIEGELTLLEDRSAEAGYVPTRLRRLELRLLLEAEGPVKAYELLEAARDRGQRLTPATVYRVLDYLQAVGLVHKVNSINAYVACNERDGGSDHHPLILVCPDCRKTTEINDRRLFEAIFARLGALGHAVEGGSVEVHGLCPLCAGK